MVFFHYTYIYSYRKKMEKTQLINTEDFQSSFEICLKENYGSEFLQLLKTGSGMITSSPKGRSNNQYCERDYRMMLFGAYTALNENILDKITE